MQFAPTALLVMTAVCVCVSVCRLSVTLSCPLDLQLFPMDTQRCKMQLESCEFAHAVLDI